MAVYPATRCVVVFILFRSAAAGCTEVPPCALTFLTFFFSARHRASLRNARSPSLSEVNAHLKETAAQDEVIQRYLARLKQKLGL